MQMNEMVVDDNTKMKMRWKSGSQVKEPEKWRQINAAETVQKPIDCQHHAHSWQNLAADAREGGPSVLLL